MKIEHILQDFQGILKPTLQKILKKCFLDTTFTVRSLSSLLHYFMVPIVDGVFHQTNLSELLSEFVLCRSVSLICWQKTGESLSLMVFFVQRLFILGKILLAHVFLRQTYRVPLLNNKALCL